MNYASFLFGLGLILIGIIDYFFSKQLLNIVKAFLNEVPNLVPIFIQNFLKDTKKSEKVTKILSLLLIFSGLIIIFYELFL